MGFSTFQIVGALQWIILIFESTFLQMALQQIEEERSKDSNTLSPNTIEGVLTASGSLQRTSNRRSRASTTNATALGTSPELTESVFHQSGNSGSSDRIRRAVSISSLNSLCRIGIQI